MSTFLIYLNIFLMICMIIENKSITKDQELSVRNTTSKSMTLSTKRYNSSVKPYNVKQSVNYSKSNNSNKKKSTNLRPINMSTEYSKLSTAPKVTFVSTNKWKIIPKVRALLNPTKPKKGRKKTTTSTPEPITTTTTKRPLVNQKKIPNLFMILIVMELFIVISLIICWTLTAYCQDSPLVEKSEPDNKPLVENGQLVSKTKNEQKPDAKNKNSPIIESSNQVLPQPKVDPLANIPEEPDQKSIDTELQTPAVPTSQTTDNPSDNEESKLRRMPSDSSDSLETGLGSSIADDKKEKEDREKEKEPDPFASVKSDGITKTEPFKLN